MDRASHFSQSSKVIAIVRHSGQGQEFFLGGGRGRVMDEMARVNCCNIKTSAKIITFV